MTTNWLDAVLSHDAKVPAAMATIVRSIGSTPRSAGARMIIYADGQTVGSIGGGCGEAQVRQAALDVMDTGQPRLVAVDLRGFYGDDEEVCGGHIEVFVEPVRSGGLAE